MKALKKISVFLAVVSVSLMAAGAASANISGTDSLTDGTWYLDKIVISETDKILPDNSESYYVMSSLFYAADLESASTSEIELGAEFLAFYELTFYPDGSAVSTIWDYDETQDQRILLGEEHTDYSVENDVVTILDDSGTPEMSLSFNQDQLIAVNKNLTYYFSQSRKKKSDTVRLAGQAAALPDQSKLYDTWEMSAIVPVSNGMLAYFWGEHGSYVVLPLRRNVVYPFPAPLCELTFNADGTAAYASFSYDEDWNKTEEKQATWNYSVSSGEVTIMSPDTEITRKLTYTDTDELLLLPYEEAGNSFNGAMFAYLLTRK